MQAIFCSNTFSIGSTQTTPTLGEFEIVSTEVKLSEYCQNYVHAIIN